MIHPAKFSLYQSFFVGLLAVSALINVLLSVKVVALHRQAIQLSESLKHATHDEQLEIGDFVPPIEATDMNGQRGEISYSGTPTIIYVFSPTCEWCNRNLASVKSLAAQTASQYRFVSLTVSEAGLIEHIRDNDIRFPIYRDPSKATLSAYKLRGTPQTFVISGDGHVVRNWQGAYSGETLEQLEQFFNIKLPESSHR